MEKIDKYLNDLYITEEINYILEFEFKSLLNKFKTKSDIMSFGKKFKSLVNVKNPEKAIKKGKQLTKNIKVELSSVDKFLSKIDKTFLKRKTLAKRILENSLSKASLSSIDIASSFLAVTSVIQKKNKQLPTNVKLKNDIKKFVTQVRKFQNEYGENEDDDSKSSSHRIPMESVPDYAIGLTIFLFGVVIIWGLVSFTEIVVTSGLWVLTSIAGILATPLTVSIAIIAVFLAIVLRKMAEG